MKVRSKGNAFERRWAEMLRDSGCDLTAKRNLEEVRESSVDIITELPFGYQVRSGHNVSIWKCIGDAQTGSVVADKHWPCGVVFSTRSKKKRKGNPPFPPLVVMLLADFVEFLEETPRRRRPEFEITAYARPKITSHYPAAKRLIRESVARREGELVEQHEYFIFEIKGRPTIIFFSAQEYLQLLKVWVERGEEVTEKLNVAVDLDGCLLSWEEGWQGIEVFGKPHQGAQMFLAKLREKYRVIIHTCRTNTELNKPRPAVNLRDIIANFLDENELEYDEIWIGEGKPVAVWYIDDRAVHCDPESDVIAFQRALIFIDGKEGKKL